MDSKDLLKEIQRLKEQNEQLQEQVRGLDILKEDRKLLVAQVNEANEKLETLLGENQQLKVENDELRAKVEQLNKSVDNADILPILTRSVTVSGEDKKFQETFHLPTTEFKIAAYSGSYTRKRDRGKIYITPNYVIFRPNTIFGTPEDVKITINDIIEIEKTKSHDHSLNLKTKDGKDHTFRAIIGRDALAEEISQQQHKGQTIAMRLSHEKV